ncbi:MAG: hypothetical protein ABJF05_08890 [Paracoccaceae bacterium]
MASPHRKLWPSTAWILLRVITDLRKFGSKVRVNYSIVPEALKQHLDALSDDLKAPAE